MTTKERDAFIATMTAEGLPVDAIRAVLRDAQTIQTCAELTCSSAAADQDRVPCPAIKSGRDADCICEYEYGGEASHKDVPRHEVRESRARWRIEAACALAGIVPVFGGDPRGACVKLRVPSGKTDDWGRTGICVPTR